MWGFNHTLIFFLNYKTFIFNIFIELKTAKLYMID